METVVEFGVGVALFVAAYRGLVGKWPWQSVEIRIPHRLASAYEIYAGWINVSIYERGRFELRRIDVVLLVAGIFCSSYYWWTSGWQGAVAGGLMYLFMLMVALWLL